MGTTLICERCKKIHRYNSSEIENLGTIWHPVWSVTCPHCGTCLTMDHGPLDFFDKPAASKDKDAYERAMSSDIREYWIQEYVRECYQKMGFSKIDGPLDIGPDFRGIRKGKEVIVEVERDFQSYIEHRHHLDKRFQEVSVLIVLNPSEPSGEIKHNLPKTIIHIDINDFVEWWRPKARAYAKTKRIQTLVDLIAGEFHSRYVKSCTNKDRDMSVCPECDLCPYFGEGICSEATTKFGEMALKFIVTYKHPLISEDFKLSGIEPHEIDTFFIEYSDMW